MENLITTRPRRTTFEALGDPFPGLKRLLFQTQDSAAQGQNLGTVTQYLDHVRTLWPCSHCYLEVFPLYTPR